MRLLGRLVIRGRGWPATGLALHLANGALFGAAFERLGCGGVKAGVGAAELENLVLWPALAVIDRVHPNRRSGAWPPLATSPRVLVYEAATHAVFGAVLGALVRKP